MPKLLYNIKAHSDDVKAISVKECEDGNYLIASAGRDSKVKVWKYDIDMESIELLCEHNEHSGFVNSITFVTLDNGSLMVASGGIDGLIYLYDVNIHQIYGTLIGHNANVCNLSTSSDNHLVSCSWDKSIKIWEGTLEITTLLGHKEAVWSSSSLSSNCIVSGSADKSIIYWENEKKTNIMDGHTDAVRSVKFLKYNWVQFGEIISVGNDGKIKFWSKKSNNCIKTIDAHDSYIYDIDISEKYIATAGEDNVIKIWIDSDGELICHKIIPIPVTSIWSISLTRNNNIICACSNGNIFVFDIEKDDDRKNSSTVVEEYYYQLKKFKINSETSKIPVKISSSEELLESGKTIGENMFIKNSDTNEVLAYQWNGNIWENIGIVTEGNVNAKKTIYKGTSYDYVFDVELESGSSLKLPYNIGDDPYTCSYKFIEDNNLSSELQEQVIDFIVKNTNTSIIGPAKEIFNPYMDSIPAKKSKNSISYIYSDVNISGIVKKLNDFNEIEEFKLDPDINLNDLAKNISRSKAIDISTTLITALSFWDINHLFPIFDALRFIDLEAQNIIFEYLTEIYSSILRLDLSSTPAILTSSRLLFNLFFTENIKNLNDTFNFDSTKNLIRLIYESTNFKDMMLPLQIISILFKKILNTDQKNLFLQFIQPFIISRLRSSTSEEEITFLIDSILLPTANLLGNRQKISIFQELDILLRSKTNLNPPLLALIQKSKLSFK